MLIFCVEGFNRTEEGPSSIAGFVCADWFGIEDAASVRFEVIERKLQVPFPRFEQDRHVAFPSFEVEDAVCRAELGF